MRLGPLSLLYLGNNRWDSNLGFLLTQLLSVTNFVHNIYHAKVIHSSTGGRQEYQCNNSVILFIVTWHVTTRMCQSFCVLCSKEKNGRF